MFEGLEITLSYKKVGNSASERLFVSFKSKNQLPWIMVIREYLEEKGEWSRVAYASVEWSFWPFSKWSLAKARQKYNTIGG